MSVKTRRLLLAISTTIILAIPLGFWILYGKTFTLVLAEKKIQEALDAKFPISKTHLGLFTVTYSNPKFILEEGSDRLQVGADAEALIKLTNRNLGGRALISGSLEYARQSGEFLLKDAKVESLKIEGIPEAYAQKVQEAASAAVKQYLDRTPVYKLNQSDLKQSLAKLILKNVEVRNKTLVVSMGIGP